MQDLQTLSVKTTYLSIYMCVSSGKALTASPTQNRRDVKVTESKIRATSMVLLVWRELLSIALHRAKLPRLSHGSSEAAPSLALKQIEELVCPIAVPSLHVMNDMAMSTATSNNGCTGSLENFPRSSKGLVDGSTPRRILVL